MSRWVSFTLLLLLALQVLLVALFSWQMRRRRIERMTWSKSQIDGWPSAEVILCLRGADEMLPAMLGAVARQKYPGEWRLQIVVDSVNDPSWKIVEEFLEFQYQLSLHLRNSIL